MTGHYPIKSKSFIGNGRSKAAMTYLHSISNIQKAEYSLLEIDDTFRELEASLHKLSISQANNEVISAMHKLTAAIQSAIIAGLDRDTIRGICHNAYRIHGKSSFVKHLQTWPLGYPGDFVAINALIDRIEESPFNTLGGMIGNYALNCLIAQQHREKITIQSEAIRNMCRKGSHLRILSVACGSSRDIEKVRYEIHKSKAEIVLLDFDQRALDESLKRLSDIKDQVNVCLTNVRKLPRLGPELGKFNLVYAGGLLDYLPEGIAKMILSGIAKKLMMSNSVLLFTNIADNDIFRSYKPWIETMADWHLLARTQEQMNALLSSTNCKNVHLELDPTGLTWIAWAYF